MSILQRAKDILSANINALLDNAEDPEKMADQYLRQYREDLADVKKDTASVMAVAEKARRRYENEVSDAGRYRTAAKNALASGNEADARTLLSRAQDADAQAAKLKLDWDSAQRDADNMKAMYQKLVQDIETLEHRKDSIKSKAARAKAQEKINATGQTAERMGDISDAFERMEAKAERQLDEASAHAQLDGMFSADEDLVEKYAGGSSASVDAELEQMRKEMGL